MSSFWLDSIKNQPKFTKLNGNYECDICIIGAGLTGLTCGYYLSRLGFNVIIVEEDEIGKKASGNTTGKITYQHNLIYNYLINSYGEKFAKAYLNANKDAIKNIKQIVDTENIDCDFEYLSNYVYTTNQSDLTKIHAEIKALQSLGETCKFVTTCGLPFKIAGALENENQAQFNPSKYIEGLSKSIIKNGSLIFTHSTVSDFEKLGENYITHIDNFEIKSSHIIVASHYPMKKISGFYFAKMYQSTSYAIAVDTHSKLFDGMYINPTSPIYSFRTAKYQGKELLILVGCDHKTGFAPTDETTYNVLENIAKKHYPDSEILYKWNTRDCISLDKIPYIGHYSSSLPGVYVATGFNKWGITSSNVAANIITDEILEKENKYAFVFNSLRFEPLRNRTELKNMTEQVFKSFVANPIKIPEEDLSKIQNDNGAIIKINGNNIGIYKDSSGKVYALKPHCTHLGCLLTWNNLDKTWDCPCHGSRFDFMGKNLYDPAFKNLEQIQLN